MQVRNIYLCRQLRTRSLEAIRGVLGKQTSGVLHGRVDNETNAIVPSLRLPALRFSGLTIQGCTMSLRSKLVVDET